MTLLIHRFLHPSSFRLLVLYSHPFCDYSFVCPPHFVSSLCLFVHSWTSSSSLYSWFLSCFNLISFKVVWFFFYVKWSCYAFFVPMRLLCMCVHLIVCVCALRVHACVYMCVCVCVCVYRQPKLKSKKPLSSKRFPKHQNQDLSQLLSAPPQRSTQESRKWKSERK